ncbi:MAG TPA: ImmA/IrrE family metallo-endopeptidase [Caulobacteraceae bacterium]|jgi:plasmid maintenance system antidote protein VapI
MTMANSFAPDWSSPPGDTIKDALACRNLTADGLASALRLSSSSVARLLSGELVIDAAVAGGLASVLGGSRHFWLRREAFYRDRLDQSLGSHDVIDFASFKAALPLKDMRSFGWLRDSRGGAEDDAIREFFEDAPDTWVQSGPALAEQVRFRTSLAHKTNPAAVAAWLRQGVRASRRIECAPWDPGKLRAALPAIRALIRVKKPINFFPKLVEIGRACGVAIIFVRSPAGCRASGATHFEAVDKAIIQLSFRYRADDQFWFTVFHEIGHLILHPTSPLFVEGQDYEMTEEESEANRFASAILVPEEFEAELGSLQRDFRAYARLAKRINISPGVLVGQMQYRGLLRHEQMNFLKERYDWVDVAALSP